MKRILKTTVVLSFILFSVACKSTKNKTKSDKVEETKVENQATLAPEIGIEPKEEKLETDGPKDQALVEEAPESTYALTVSFYSIGEGADGNALINFKRYLETFNKEEKVSVKFETTPWGREGEIDYCFRLFELKGKLKEKFISGAKMVFTEKNLVHIAENGRCHAKRP